MGPYYAWLAAIAVVTILVLTALRSIWLALALLGGGILGLALLLAILHWRNARER